MPALPPRADLDQLRRLAKDRLRAARAGDPDAVAWITADGGDLTLATSQLRLAREHGFPSWPAMQLEIARRAVLDRHDPAALAELIARHPEAATAEMREWLDHPLGATPLGYVAMARYDTVNDRWRDVEGTADAARLLIEHGALVDGDPDDSETPLITAASYGDAAVASVLIAAGADIDAVSSPTSGGVPGGSAVLHAAVFGMTEVLDVLVAAGARIRSIEEAAAAGDLTGWLDDSTPLQAKVRSLVMASEHQRIAVIDELVAAGTPVDEEDEVFHRHPLRLAAANGRARSVRALLGHGADPSRRGHDGRGPLDLARANGHDDVASILTAWMRPPSP